MPTPSITFVDAPPIFVARFEGAATEEDYQAYLDWMTHALESQKPCLFVLDAQRAGKTTQSQRTRQGKWLLAHKKALASDCLGIVFVFKSRLMKMALKSITLIAPIPTAHHVADDLPGARVWIEEKLRSAGQPIPAALQAW
jgi:hypothetical protein